MKGNGKKNITFCLSNKSALLLWYWPFDSLVRYTYIFFYWSLAIITPKRAHVRNRKSKRKGMKNQIAIGMTNIYVILLVSKILDSFLTCRVQKKKRQQQQRWCYRVTAFLLHAHGNSKSFPFFMRFLLFTRNSKCMQRASQPAVTEHIQAKRRSSIP